MKRIPSLDGIRALSITLVIGGHLIACLNGRHQFPTHLAGCLQGFQGVFVFFVISGYLITTLLLREYDRHSTIRLGRFYYRRFFRIIPPLYAYILIAVVVIAPCLGIHAELREVLTSLTFTRNLDFHPHQVLFEHFWSLSIEEQFYLLWPITLLAVLRHKGRAGATKLAFWLIILSPLYRLATFALIRAQLVRIFVNWLLPGHLDSLMFGCWAALAEGTPAFEALYARITRYVWVLPIVFLVISTQLMVHFGNFYYLSLGHTVDGIAVVFAMLWAIRNKQSLVGRFLNWGPIVHIGLISYGLYIWQNAFVNEPNHTITGQLPWSLLIPLAAAEISWRTIERGSYYLRDSLEPVVFSADRRSARTPVESAPES